ncbi:Putative auto-transporter adhesin, head GIN domain [Flavobacterium saccharophilum]|uniref:Putative auto-transporter adhesin, head GIN domain n=2 Tax=Flavobacterium saccharophilum TaxID=29534 RepID=A0A1M7JYC6_9FLAO|nr:Putative auto-transporter adhesin, head GIN domain [Flavobacterium saccharophilum]
MIFLYLSKSNLELMKKSTALLLLLLVTTLTFAQKREKIKGTKIVTTSIKETGNFDALEVDDNIEVYLERGEKNEIKIEADDNLHDIIGMDLREKTLRLYTSKESTIFKKLTVRVTYTNTFNKVITKNEAVVYAIQELQLDDITFNSFDFSKLFLNVNAKKFSLIADDKSKSEINLKADDASLQLSKTSAIKSLVAATKFQCDLYQKATATLEGIAEKATIRLDNNSTFTGIKFTMKDADITAEGSSKGSVLAETTLKLAAGDQTELSLFGSPAITLSRFSEEAKLIKKIK